MVKDLIPEAQKDINWKIKDITSGMKDSKWKYFTIGLGFGILLVKAFVYLFQLSIIS